MRNITRRIALNIRALACALLLLAGARTAHADSKNKIAAEALFDQGTQLLSSGRYPEACAKFEASQALDSGIGTLLYLGDCYERVGRNASAWATFREAESLARGSSQMERAQVAAARANVLERKLSKLAIIVPHENRVPGLSVRIESTEVPAASYGDYLPVDPGERHIEVSAPGRVPLQQIVRVGKNGAAKYRFIVPRLDPVPKPEQKPESSDNTLKTVSLITGGAGIVAVGAGAVFGVMAAKKNDDSLEQCPAGPAQCTPQGVALREEAGDYADIATASFAAGGGLILTGIVLYIAAPSSPQRERVRAAKLAELTVAPSMPKGGLGVSLRGRF